LRREKKAHKISAAPRRAPRRLIAHRRLWSWMWNLGLIALVVDAPRVTAEAAGTVMPSAST